MPAIPCIPKRLGHFYMRILVAVLVWGGILFTACVSGQEEIPYGTWKVVAPPDFVADEFAQVGDQYLGQTILIQPDSFVIFFTRDGYPPFELSETVCYQPQYELIGESDERFYRNLEAPMSDLLGPGRTSVMTLEADCTEVDAGGIFYIIEDDLLLLHYIGFLLYLEKEKKKRCLLWPFGKKN
jgi:hypothetical protein